MKKKFHKPKKLAGRALTLALALLLTVSCCAIPAGAADFTVLVPDDTVSSQPGEVPADGETALPPESSGPEGKENFAPSLAEPDEPSSSMPEESQPEDTVKKYTLTFRMGSFGTKTIEVEEGQYPSEVPAIPELAAASVLGWYDGTGQQVSPASLPASADAAYTARWSRQVSSLMNTDDHIAYIKGYENGMFKPQKGVTRAEAAQMFFSLLRSTEYGQKTFFDVAADHWCYKALGIMAELGILSGYTDGKFRPNQEITRAEFVKMAVSCDTLGDTPNTFTDVAANSWAAPYIATAAEKGWVAGSGDNKFGPNDKITRGQAVTIINNMLGRSADAGIKTMSDVKNFYDVFPDNWAYGDIEEAATPHSASLTEGGETWTSYEHDTGTVAKSTWVKDNSDRYYLDAKTKKFVRGTVTIDGVKYIMDSFSGKAYTGFRMDGSWRRYYKNGLLQNDISGLGVVSGPYYIKVYKQSNYLIIFAKDEKGKYNTPVRSMRVSCGYGTPCGTFYTPDRYRWLKMVGDTYAQWCTQIQGNYLFHSVPNWTWNNFDLEVDEYNHLGDTRSLGCIRLNCRDAKWIYDNCVLGTEVFISAVETSGPLKKPDGLQIPSWHSWDPTDPTAYYRCRQAGCH